MSVKILNTIIVVTYCKVTQISYILVHSAIHLLLQSTFPNSHQHLKKLNDDILESEFLEFHID